jgi:hypothetical protein
MAGALDAVAAAAAAHAVLEGALAEDVGDVAAACDAAGAVGVLEAALAGRERGSGGGAGLTRAWVVAGEPGALLFLCATESGEVGGAAAGPLELAALPQTLEAALLDCGTPIAGALSRGLPPPPGLDRLLSLASSVAVMRAAALRLACGRGGAEALAPAADAVALAAGARWPWEGQGGDAARRALREALEREAALCGAHGAALAAGSALREALEGAGAPRVGALRMPLPPPAEVFRGAGLRVGEGGGERQDAPPELLLPDVPPLEALVAALDGALALADGASRRGGAGDGEGGRLRAAAAQLRAARAFVAGGRYQDALDAAEAAAAGARALLPRAAEEFTLIARLCAAVLSRAGAAQGVARLLRAPRGAPALRGALWGALWVGAHVDPVWSRLTARALEELRKLE